MTGEPLRPPRCNGEIGRRQGVAHPALPARRPYAHWARMYLRGIGLSSGRTRDLILTSSRTPQRNVTIRIARGSAAALIGLSIVCACSPKAGEKSAQATAAVTKPADTTAGTMPGMAGMTGMDAPVTIPPGADYTEADVRFMQGMIAHHGQAIYMSQMAAAHGANPRLLKLANKIDQSQQAEIRLMQGWLRANHQSAPDADSWHHVMMSGMLTADQLKTLDASHGTEFDKNYLNMMIQHHEGALKMVNDLLATPMAGQDVDVSVFANDVTTVQTAEIGAMQQMLASL